ncbi:hypothetical protein NDU88_003820 [Pleurodeles waltl]|uniref:Uncharacterized protein n=1 Tax=Pleurodeles waltl TaxID=8319 RepID=A0AAV7KZL3_PLEWA|nr:hypothetical protein NDU88_003820 [Pleurodeles waltl]
MRCEGLTDAETTAGMRHAVRQHVARVLQQDVWLPWHAEHEPRPVVCLPPIMAPPPMTSAWLSRIGEREGFRVTRNYTFRSRSC